MKKLLLSKISFFAALLLVANSLSAQTKPDSIKLIQFSGVVVHEENEEILPLPYTNVSVFGTTRGTSAGEDGFFSLVAWEGDTVVFTRIGYKPIEFIIPDTLSTHHYSLVQIMSKDEYILPETVIYPWPSREHFDIEFLAMDVSDEMTRRSKENLAAEALSRMRNAVPVDGAEGVDLYLRQQAATNYYQGQFRPQNVFNPVAWKQFIDAWKRGDYKKKKKKKN